MKKMIALAVVVALAGCHSLSSATLSEAHTAEAVGEGVLDTWGTLTDDQKKTAVTKLTRAQASVLLDADGTPLPARFVPAPSPSPSPSGQ